MKKILHLMLMLFVLALSAQAGKLEIIDGKVEKLLSRMTLAEKIGQLQTYSMGSHPDSFRQMIVSGAAGSFFNVHDVEMSNKLQKWAVEETRLGIPLIIGQDVIHGYRTIFPIPLAEAASWDPALVEEAAAVAARETRADGTHWTFAPMLDIARDPRWGRIAEGGGEDPYLVSALARAMVRGFQGKDFSAPDRIVACTKHYVGYGAAEGGRDYNSTEISERTLRQVYLPPFEAAVRQGAGTVMSAFNDLNGMPASCNAFTLTQVLRNEWGFQGFVVSDWNSIGELLAHGIAASPSEAGFKALTAGVDMDMEGGIYRNVLSGLVDEKKLDVGVIDEAVRRILRIKYALGLFERPYSDAAARDAATLTPENLLVARRLARESIVLLKNEGGLLPLKKTVTSIAVIGPLADSPVDMLGCWSCMGQGRDAVSVLRGIKNHLPAATKVIFDSAGSVLHCSAKAIKRAVEGAKRADVIVAVVGESSNMSGEASCRADISLPGDQQALLQALQTTGKPVVAVVLSGRPLVISWTAANIPAVLMAWHGGVQAGEALADVLFGDYNPSGRLPVTVPRALGQIPIYYNHKNTGRPFQANNYFTSKYLDESVQPIYPFGYGLSYSRFAYENLQIAVDGQTVTASIDVQNKGPLAGDEVVQAYLRDLAGSVTRPVRELKGFSRIALQAGERKTVTFKLGFDELSFINDRMERVVEPGSFHLWIGPNSTDGLEGGFTIN